MTSDAGRRPLYEPDGGRFGLGKAAAIGTTSGEWSSSCGPDGPVWSVGAGAAGWWFLFTFVLNIYRKRFRPRYLLWMNRIAGILIILLGVTAIISSLFNIHFDELIPK